VPFALGSQTAGSVLRPGAYNGAIGLKPTYGRSSKRGVFPLAWTLDHVGLLARSVEDCALFLSVVAGFDPNDSTTVDTPVPSFLTGEPQAPPRLGLVSETLRIATPAVADHVLGLAREFERAGARVEEVTLRTPLDLIAAVHHTTMQVEVAAVHWQLLEQYPGAHAPRLRAYVEVARLVPGIAYLHAQRLRRRIRAALLRSLGGVDALLLPTAVNVAPTLETTGDPSLQIPFSLVGFPAISVPSGLAEPERLPLAFQLVCAPWQEPALLRIAQWCIEQLPPMPAPPV
jgi:aspartyl-tRNA(Asn)/glutamyl-tRNA(Gln) amidotransferase subunit A